MIAARLARMVTFMEQEQSLPEWSIAILILRQRMRLSQSEFGSRLHYSAMAVSRWETGKQEPTSRCFIQIGNMAGQPDCWLFWARAGLNNSDLRQMFPGTRSAASMTTSMDFEIIFAGSRAKKKRAKDAPKLLLVAVPLLDVQAGTIGQPGGQFTDFDSATSDEMIAAPAFWCPNPVQTNCLRVSGTSMSPLINDGDVVAVDGSQTNPGELNGKIVVAWHRDGGISLARFISTNGVQLLESENREYSPVNVEKDRKWQIVGRVLWWIRKGP
jgi:DNA-binding XRE family transcriptional regulator